MGPPPFSAGGSGGNGGNSGNAAGPQTRTQTQTETRQGPLSCCPLCDPRSSKHFHLAYDLRSTTPVFKGR